MQIKWLCPFWVHLLQCKKVVMDILSTTRTMNFFTLS